MRGIDPSRKIERKRSLTELAAHQQAAAHHQEATAAAEATHDALAAARRKLSDCRAEYDTATDAFALRSTESARAAERASVLEDWQRRLEGLSAGVKRIVDQARSDPHGPFRRQPLERIDETPDAPVPFGYKMTWIAIRLSDPTAILDVLPIDELQRANWSTGISAAYSHHTFVSPPIDGWVLVLSNNIPGLDTEDRSADWKRLMERLADHFDDVQSFSTHRVVEYHAWARFLKGKEIRAYAYTGESGETLVDRGERTEAEIELGHNFFDERSPAAESEEYWEREDLTYPDEEDVMRVAGKWSINPTRLGHLSAPPSVAWIAAICRERL